MQSVEVGQIAPPFRLPSGQGPVIGLDDYRGRQNLVVWLTKGMSCPFCRQHMSQLVRGYPAIRALNAEILEVTATPLERGRFYVSKFSIPFPYLCDPDYVVPRTWGLGKRSHSLGWYAKAVYKGMRMQPPPSDFGDVAASLGELPRTIADTDMGFYILDRNSMVRYSVAGAYITQGTARQIPSNDDIVRELKLCEGA